jgi:hypothetical protein
MEEKISKLEGEYMDMRCKYEQNGRALEGLEYELK